MQNRLNLRAQGFISTGNDRGRQRMFCDFTRQVRPRQHANPRLRGDLFKNFAHQFEAVGFNAFGQADEHFAAQALGMR